MPDIRHDGAEVDDPGSDPVDCDALFEDYRRTRSRSIRNQLVVAHSWLAERCARRFRNRGTPVADLSQVGQVGLIKAVERYDVDRGIPFERFATPTVLGEIKRYFRDATWSVSVPRRSKEMRGTVNAATDELSQRLGREPTPDEIARFTDSDLDEVTASQRANRAYRAEPLDGRGGPEAVDPMPVRAGEMTDHALDRVEALEALRDLPDRDRKIVVWRYYEDRTQREIGERLGVSQVQVSRLLRAALGRMRRRMAPGGQARDPVR